MVEEAPEAEEPPTTEFLSPIEAPAAEEVTDAVRPIVLLESIRKDRFLRRTMSGIFFQESGPPEDDEGEREAAMEIAGQSAGESGADTEGILACG